MCAHCRLRSARASALSDQPWVLSYPLSASKDSDQTGLMPRLIWVFPWRMSFCWFCHVAAHMLSCAESRKTVTEHKLFFINFLFFLIWVLGLVKIISLILSRVSHKVGLNDEWFRALKFSVLNHPAMGADLNINWQRMSVWTQVDESCQVFQCLDLQKELDLRGLTWKNWPDNQYSQSYLSAYSLVLTFHLHKFYVMWLNFFLNWVSPRKVTAMSCDWLDLWEERIEMEQRDVHFNQR